jgi:hypothetical protein
MNFHFVKSISRAAAMTALIVFVSTFAALAQTAREFPNFKTMQTGKGLMLMNKSGSQDYAVLIPGGEEAEHQDFDGTLLVKTKNGDFYAYAASLKPFKFSVNKPVREILQALKDWQIEGVEDMTGESLKVGMETTGEIPVFDLRNGKNAVVNLDSIMWTIPFNSADGETRLYQAVVLGDSFLIIRKTFLRTDKPEQAVNSFEEIFQTLTILPPQKLKAAAKKPRLKSGKKN